MTPKPQSLKTKDATYLLKVSSRSAECFVSWPKLIEPLPGTCVLWQREKRSCSSTSWFLKLPARSVTHRGCTPFTGQSKFPSQPVSEQGGTLFSQREAGSTWAATHPIYLTKPHAKPVSNLETSWIIHSYFVSQQTVQGEVPTMLICKRDTSANK